MKDNMTKTERLQELFDSWKEEQHNESTQSLRRTKIESKNITKDHFCADGIIDEAVFEKEERKVLFITNEPNIEKYINKESSEWSRINDFTDYYNNNKDAWGGKLRKKICILYKVIIKDYMIPSHKVATRFAFMNLNKRGGDNSIGAYFENYVDAYSAYIIKEINIIDPDIIVWLSEKTFPLCQKYLGAYLENEKVYMNLNNREVPVLKLPHPSMACCWKVEPIIFQNNRTHGKLASRMMAELERYNLQ